MAERHFLTNRPISSHFCSVALITDKWGADWPVIKYSWICFFWQASWKHTHTHLSNLVKNIFCPVNPLFLILIYAYINECNSLILILILFDLCQFLNLLCPIRISHLLFLSCKSQTGQQWVSDLIYTLDPWPLTEPDRFQSTTTHVSMPCPPSVSHFNGTAQFSDILCPDFKCFQTLNPSFLVHNQP